MKNKSDVADATAEDIAGAAMSPPVVAQAGLKTTGLSDDDESTDTDDGEGKEESKGNLTELATTKKSRLRWCVVVANYGCFSTSLWIGPCCQHGQLLHKSNGRLDAIEREGLYAW